MFRRPNQTLLADEDSGSVVATKVDFATSSTDVGRMLEVNGFIHEPDKSFAYPLYYNLVKVLVDLPFLPLLLTFLQLVVLE